MLTHAHFDHVGFAERARRELGVPVYVHESDAPLTRHPWRYDHERGRARYFATQVRAFPIPHSGSVVNQYAIATTQQSGAPDLAADWVDLVTSAHGQRVLADAGFGPAD